MAVEVDHPPQVCHRAAGRARGGEGPPPAESFCRRGIQYYCVPAFGQYLAGRNHVFEGRDGGARKSGHRIPRANVPISAAGQIDDLRTPAVVGFPLDPSLVYDPLRLLSYRRREVVVIRRIGNRFGAEARTNHAILRFDPVIVSGTCIRLRISLVFPAN